MDDDDYADVESLRTSIPAFSPALSQYTYQPQEQSLHPSSLSQASTRLPAYRAAGSDYPPSYATAPPLPPRGDLPESTPASQNTSSISYDTQDERRRLLIIYIHGFMGTETSFQSFPRHVHDLVSILLSNSHVVHTKIYPRYRSKDAIQVARDQFSAWLKPHESATTDIILCGHSMGGILSAEVALLKAGGSISLKHNILGTISFDTPFLGMHPGIIAAGISSIFSTKHAATVKSPPASTPFASSHSAAYFNAAFSNDVTLPTRSGWANALNFVMGSQDLRIATRQLISSYADFGSCLADYDGLKERYRRIRILEEEDESVRMNVLRTRDTPRIRFVNYYTVSTGKVKKPKPKSSSADLRPTQSAPSLLGPNEHESTEATSQQTSPPLPSAATLPDVPSRRSSTSSQSSSATLTDVPTDDNMTQGSQAAAHPPQLPAAFPSPPQPPVPPPLRTVDDIKSYNTLVKAYERDIKAYRKQIKSLAKPLKSAEKKRSKATRDNSRTTSQADEQHIRNPSTPNNASTSSPQHQPHPHPLSPTPIPDPFKPPKSPKPRTFCVLPPLDSRNIPDPCWVKVFMQGVDEVRAHCGLFFSEDVDPDADTNPDLNVVNDNQANLSTANELNTHESARGQVLSDATSTTATAAENDQASSSTAIEEYIGPGAPTASSPSAPSTAATLTSESLPHDAGAPDPPTSVPASLGEASKPDDEEETRWGERYAGFVQDVSARIEGWVLEAMSERLARGMRGWER